MILITLNFKKGIKEKITGNSVEFTSLISKTIAYKIKTSLILLIKTAFKADLFAAILVNQKFINK